MREALADIGFTEEEGGKIVRALGAVLALTLLKFDGRDGDEGNRWRHHPFAPWLRPPRARPPPQLHGHGRAHRPPLLQTRRRPPYWRPGSPRAI